MALGHPGSGKTAYCSRQDVSVSNKTVFNQNGFIFDFLFISLENEQTYLCYVFFLFRFLVLAEDVQHSFCFMIFLLFSLIILKIFWGFCYHILSLQIHPRIAPFT